MSCGLVTAAWLPLGRQCCQLLSSARSTMQAVGDRKSLLALTLCAYIVVCVCLCWLLCAGAADDP